MIIIDSALKKREEENNPVKVGIIGAGYMGRGITKTVESHVPGMKIAAIYNRTLSWAERAYRDAGVSGYRKAESVAHMDEIIADGGHAITDNSSLVCQSGEIDVLIEATGQIEFGTIVTIEALENKKHMVLLNAELDATLGPLLKSYADEKGVVYTNADGDQPGVIMNLYRFVETIGYKPVLAGNIKGLVDSYRTPKTQEEFARKHKQNPKMVTSFADGTKLSMEMAVVANATGFKVGKRGMYGPACNHVEEALNLFSGEVMLNGGLVDYVLGAEPGPGVFVIGHNDHPVQKEYMEYLKMGDGPFYLFYVPYHLPHLEVPITAARAALFNDAAIAPKGKPVCEVVTLAKKDLKAGDRLDGIGGYTCYGIIDNSEVARAENLLPMGLSKDCVLKSDIPKDHPIRFDEVETPDGRLSDRLWKEQLNRFLDPGEYQVLLMGLMLCL